MNMVRLVLVEWDTEDWRIFRQTQWMGLVRDEPRLAARPREHYDIDESVLAEGRKDWGISGAVRDHLTAVAYLEGHGAVAIRREDSARSLRTSGNIPSEKPGALLSPPAPHDAEPRGSFSMAGPANTPADPSLETTEVSTGPTGASEIPHQAAPVIGGNASPVADQIRTAPDAQTVSPTSVDSAATPGGQIDNQADPDIHQETQQEAMGVGVEGEVNVWESRYSMKNFYTRILLWTVVTIGWGWLFYWVSDANKTGDGGLSVMAWVTGIAVLILWLNLIRRIVLARFAHYYRLTNRRIVVSTGLFNRRRDQMELLRLQDVFTKQTTLVQRLLSIGTVVIVPNDQTQPTLYLAGVDDPKYVNDLVWHHARAERDRRSVKVDQV